MKVFLAALLWLLPVAAWGQAPPNPPTGSVWTYMGPTIGPAWSGPQAYGCKGDGVTDDTTCLQAAINAAADGVLVFDGVHKYKITSTLVINDHPVTLEGTNGNLGIYATTCPNGIIVDTNITAIQMTSNTGTIRGLCIQMASAFGVRTSGSAIWAGTHTTTPSTTGQGRALIENNTIINAFNGIEIGARSAGKPQTNTDVVRNNTIRNPSNIGIMSGFYSTVGSTIVEMRGNQVACYTTNTTQIGVYIGDGAVFYDGANSGPYNCNTGMKIYAAAGQAVAGSEFTGVIADNTAHGLIIDTVGGGDVQPVSFNNFWIAGNNPAVLIQGNSTHGVSFIGGTIMSCSGPNVLVQGNTSDIMFVGNQIKPSCTGVHNAGIYLSDSASSILINNNTFAPLPKADVNFYFNTALTIASSGDLFTIVGNDWSTSGAPSFLNPFDLSGWTSTTRRAVIRDNMPTSVNAVDVVVASTITGPSSYDVWKLSNTVITVNAITNYWSGRQVLMIPAAATPFVGGSPGPTGLCNGLTATPSVPITAIWVIASNCWYLK